MGLTISDYTIQLIVIYLSTWWKNTIGILVTNSSVRADSGSVTATDLLDENNYKNTYFMFELFGRKCSAI